MYYYELRCRRENPFYFAATLKGLLKLSYRSFLTFFVGFVKVAKAIFGLLLSSINSRICGVALTCIPYPLYLIQFFIFFALRRYFSWCCQSLWKTKTLPLTFFLLSSFYLHLLFSSVANFLAKLEISFNKLTQNASESSKFWTKVNLNVVEII